MPAVNYLSAARNSKSRPRADAGSAPSRRSALRECARSAPRQAWRPSRSRETMTADQAREPRCSQSCEKHTRMTRTWCLFRYRVHTKRHKQQHRTRKKEVTCWAGASTGARQRFPYISSHCRGNTIISQVTPSGAPPPPPMPVPSKPVGATSQRQHAPSAKNKNCFRLFLSPWWGSRRAARSRRLCRVKRVS